MSANLNARQMAFAVELEGSIYRLYHKVTGDVFQKLRKQVQSRKLHIMFEPELNCDPKTDHLLPKDVLPLFDGYFGNAESMLDCTFKLILANTVKEHVSTLTISEGTESQFYQDEMNYLYIQLAAAQRVIQKQTKAFSEEKAKLKQQIQTLREQAYIIQMGNMLYSADGMKEFSREAAKNPKLQAKLQEHIQAKKSQQQDFLLKAEMSIQRMQKDCDDMLPEQKEQQLAKIDDVQKDVGDFEEKIADIEKAYQIQIQAAYEHEQELEDQLQKTKLEVAKQKQEMEVAEQKLDIAQRNNSELETHLKKLQFIQKKLDQQNSNDSRLNIEINENQQRIQQLSSRERREQEETVTDFQLKVGHKIVNQKQQLLDGGNMSYKLQIEGLNNENSKLRKEIDELQLKVKTQLKIAKSQDTQQENQESKDAASQLREKSKANVSSSKLHKDKSGVKLGGDAKADQKVEKSKRSQAPKDQPLSVNEKYLEEKVAEYEATIAKLRQQVADLQLELKTRAAIDQSVPFSQSEAAERTRLIEQKAKAFVIKEKIVVNGQTLENMTTEELLMTLQKQANDLGTENKMLIKLLEKLGFDMGQQLTEKLLDQYLKMAECMTTGYNIVPQSGLKPQYPSSQEYDPNRPNAVFGQQNTVNQEGQNAATNLTSQHQQQLSGNNLSGQNSNQINGNIQPGQNFKQVSQTNQQGDTTNEIQKDSGTFNNTSVGSYQKANNQGNDANFEQSLLNDQKSLLQQQEQASKIIDDVKNSIIRQFLRIDEEQLKNMSVTDIPKYLQKLLQDLINNPHSVAEQQELSKFANQFVQTEVQLQSITSLINKNNENPELKYQQLIKGAEQLQQLQMNQQLNYDMQTVNELNNVAKRAIQVKNFGVQVEYGKMLSGSTEDLTDEFKQQLQKAHLDIQLNNIKPENDMLNKFKNIYQSVQGANVFERLYNMSKLVHSYHQQRIEDYKKQNLQKYQNGPLIDLASSLIFGTDFLYEVGFALPERQMSEENQYHLDTMNLKSRIGDTAINSQLSDSMLSSRFLTDIPRVQFDQPDLSSLSSNRLRTSPKPLTSSYMNRMSGFYNQNIASSINQQVSVIISNADGFELPDISKSVAPFKTKTSVVQYRKNTSRSSQLSQVQNPQFLEVKKM